MKKVIAVFLAVLMFAGVMQVTAVPVFAEDNMDDIIDEAPVPEGWTLPGDGAVSGYKPFEHQCDYCGETHEGFIGIFITMLHTFLSAIQLVQKAIQK